MSPEFADLSPWLWLAAPLVVVLAYTVFGLSGFGSTVISVPLLAHFLPVSYLVPLMAVLDLACAAFIGGSNRQHVSREEVMRLGPFMLVGMVVGVTVLVGVPDQYLRAALGVFSVAVGVHGMVNPVLNRTISKLWAIPAGIAGGAIAATFGAGGPIYATYLSGRLTEKAAMRSTMSALISLSALSRATIYAVSGLLLHLAILAGAVVLSPFVWLGLKIGTRIHLGLTQQQMRRAIGAVVSLTGVSLLARSLL